MNIITYHLIMMTYQKYVDNGHKVEPECAGSYPMVLSDVVDGINVDINDGRSDYI